MALPTELPVRIQSALTGSGRLLSDVVCVLQTAYKPNATVPIIWLVAFRDSLLLCNTHRTRWLWETYAANNLDVVRTKRLPLGNLAIEILTNDHRHDEVLLPLPPSTSEAEVDEFLDACRDIAGSKPRR